MMSKLLGQVIASLAIKQILPLEEFRPASWAECIGLDRAGDNAFVEV